MNMTKGNKEKTAQHLKITRKQLNYLLKKYGIEYE